VLHRELVDAGFDRSYPTLVRELRRLELRPVCLLCEHRRGDSVTVEIDHPPGEKIQWDWLELAPEDVPWGEPAFVLIGALSHSGRFRGVFCEQMTFGHLAEAMHRVLVALGGTPRVWRTDRMATIVVPGTDRLTVDAAQAAKHYGVDIAVCPARRAQRKGVVEAAIKYATRSWWRNARVATIAEAQASLDRWCVTVADERKRPAGTVAQIGAAEPLRSLPPAAYPAVIAVERRASRLVTLYACSSERSPEMRAGAEYFAEPGEPAQRRYEALRAYFVDELSAAQVATRFGYSPAVVHQMASDLRAGRAVFFRDSKPGPKGASKAGRIRDDVLALRARDRSIEEIAAALAAAGSPVSAQTVWSILDSEGLERLPRRAAGKRGVPAPRLAPIKARALEDWPAGEQIAYSTVKVGLSEGDRR